MSKAFLAYYSDFVLGASGAPISGAAASMFSASQFANGTLPVGPTPGPTPVATAVTDATGRFTFPALPPDDYHLLVTYTPLGGSQVVGWSYFVPVASADMIRRAVAAPRAGALPRTLGRLALGANVTIVCLGDDLTVGYNATGTVLGGWVALLAAQLAVLYPTATVTRQDPTNFAVTSDGPIPSWGAVTVQTGTGSQTITVVNAGVKGDTVLRCLRRFANLQTSWPGADVVICGFGLWDSTSGAAQQYTDAASFGSNLESLVNIVRCFTQAETLLLTPCANPPSGNLDNYADAARAVAARCRTDLCDLRALWLDRFLVGGANDGYDPWLNSGVSRILPTDLGHSAVAGEVVKHFAPGTAVPYEAGVYGVGKSWELARVPYSSGQVAILGSGWTAHSGWLGALLGSAGGTEQLTSHTGDTVSISGRFVDLAMLCRRGPDSGQVNVVVDGGAAVMVDLYRGYPASTSDLGDSNGAWAPQDRVLLAHGLTDAVHTVVVTVLGSKNVLSTGYALRFESFELGRWRKHGYEVEAADVQTKVQRGQVNVTLTAAASGTQVVTFPTVYTAQSGNATVVATCLDPNYYCAANMVGNTSFTLVAVRRDGTNVTATPACMWIALG